MCGFHGDSAKVLNRQFFAFSNYATASANWKTSHISIPLKEHDSRKTKHSRRPDQNLYPFWTSDRHNAVETPRFTSNRQIKSATIDRTRPLVFGSSIEIRIKFLKSISDRVFFSINFFYLVLSSCVRKFRLQIFSIRVWSVVS